MSNLCPECVEGHILSGEPTGTILSDFQGAYYAAAAPVISQETGDSGGSASVTKLCAVLLLTDAFGMPLVNCKLMADAFAKRLGCDVWIPDYFNGKPLMPHEKMVLPDRAGAHFGMWAWIRLFVKLIPQIPTLISNRPSVVDKRLESFIGLIKEKKGYERIGTVGYCFGGTTCVRVGGTDLVNSVVIAHPGAFSLAQVQAIKVPAAWVCAEEDMTFSDTLRSQSEAVFAARKDKSDFVDYEFTIYKGTAHGFASRPNLQLPEIKEAYNGAIEQTVAWFKKTLLV